MPIVERSLKHFGNRHSTVFGAQSSPREEARPCGGHETIQAQPAQPRLDDEDCNEDVEKGDERKAIELFPADVGFTLKPSSQVFHMFQAV